MKYTTSILIALLATLSLSAQDWDPEVYKSGEQYPGYVILEDGTKKEGFIQLSNRYKMQNEILFYAEKGNKKTKEKYKTADLQQYKIADKLYHCIHYSGGLMSKPVRANLVVNEDCITEYVWYNRADDYLSMRQSSSESYEEYMARMYPPVAVFQKEGEESPRSIDYFALKFSKKMAEFVAENKELAAKVTAKEKGYGMLKVLDIIAEYNENCETE